MLILSLKKLGQRLSRLSYLRAFMQTHTRARTRRVHSGSAAQLPRAGRREACACSDPNIQTHVAVEGLLRRVIFSSTFYNFYSDSLITTINVPFRSTPSSPNDIVESTQVLLINLSDSTSGKVSCTQYIGNININNIPITAITQYVYSFFLQLSTHYSEYSAAEQAERANSDGSSITNNGATNLTNVSYSFITNFDNINSNFYSSSENCITSLYNDNAEIDANSILYKEFSITSNISG